MAALELKAIDLDITTIMINQVFGYQTTYIKNALVKHRKKKINNKWYDTKKSTLIVYDNDYTHDNNFSVTFIYKTEDSEYFMRQFTPMGESFNIVNEHIVLIYAKRNITLF